jgi:hemerythrin-like domain-containing protein
MIEHRLIEKMLDAIRMQIPVIKERKHVDPVFIDTVVDFIKVYADRTHHGKEEDILFRQLSMKNLNHDDKKIMADLIEEHKFGRRLTADIVKAEKDYRSGRLEALSVILEKMNALVDFYPEHIFKEDKVFFPNTEKYLTPNEQDSMLDEFWEFDRKMIHEKYASVLENLKE